MSQMENLSKALDNLFDARQRGSHDEEREALNLVISALAHLEEIEYLLVRAETAEKLGLRLGDIDRIVKHRRKEQAEDQQIIIAPNPEPWDEVVIGNELADDIFDLIKTYVVLSDAAATAVTLWIFFAWMHEHPAIRISPKLLITSPTKRCGKTTLVTLLSGLLPNPMLTSNLTPAVIYRTIDYMRPTTVVMDEADTYATMDPVMRGILNGSHRRDLANTIRLVGDNYTPKRFSTWAPQVIALIGWMPATNMDRSIEIPLQRKPTKVRTRRLPYDVRAALSDYQSCLIRWCEDNAENMQDLRRKMKMPALLNDRARDNWRALFHIAELIGAEWPDKARDAACLLQRDYDDDDSGEVLLSDIRDVFAREFRRKKVESDEDALPSTDLVHELVKLQNRPWAEYKNGKPLSVNQLAYLLKPYRIKPRQIWLNDENVHGYRRGQFKRAWARYTTVNKKPVA